MLTGTGRGRAAGGRTGIVTGLGLAMAYWSRSAKFSAAAAFRASSWIM